MLGRRKDRQGWQAERINIRNLGMREERRVKMEKRRRGGHQGPATRPHNQPWSKKERKVCRIE